MQVRSLELTLNHSFTLSPTFTHSLNPSAYISQMSIKCFPPLHSNCLFLGSGPHHFTLIGCPSYSLLPASPSSTLLWQSASWKVNVLTPVPLEGIHGVCALTAAYLSGSSITNSPEHPRLWPQLYFPEQAGAFVYFGIYCFPNQNVFLPWLYGILYASLKI